MVNWALTQIVPPSVEPVTLSELKSQTHITHGYQDDTLNSYIRAGRIHAEDYQRQSYITQDWLLTIDCLPNDYLLLLRGPVQELLSIKMYDIDNTEYTLDLNDFYLENDHNPAKLIVNSGASIPNIELRKTGGIKIEYRAGYGDTPADVPADVKHAIILFASFADDNRAAEVEELPMSIKNLLQPRRIETNGPWK
jgi:uncharacterized phiE125 gp8 family phage protein